MINNTPDGHLLGRCDGEAASKAFLGTSAELVRNGHGLAEFAEPDVDEVGYSLSKVDETKMQRQPGG